MWSDCLMDRVRVLALSALAVVALAPADLSYAGNSYEGECEFEFGGKTIIKGTCSITPLANGGFIMYSKNTYAAMVKAKSENSGVAYWSKVKGGKPDRASLGPVVWFNGCWTNEVAAICAAMGE